MKKITIDDILSDEDPSFKIWAKAYHENQRLSPAYEEILLEFKSLTWIYKYIKDFIKERWPEAEIIFLEELERYSKDWWAMRLCLGEIIDYTKEIIGGRWLELEPILLRFKDDRYLFGYVHKILGGKWPEEPMWEEATKLREEHERLKKIQVFINNSIHVLKLENEQNDSKLRGTW